MTGCRRPTSSMDALRSATLSRLRKPRACRTSCRMPVQRQRHQLQPGSPPPVRRRPERRSARIRRPAGVESEHRFLRIPACFLQGRDVLYSYIIIPRHQQVARYPPNVPEGGLAAAGPGRRGRISDEQPAAGTAHSRIEDGIRLVRHESHAASANPSPTSRTWSAACEPRRCPHCKRWPTRLAKPVSYFLTGEDEQSSRLTGLNEPFPIPPPEITKLMAEHTVEQLMTAGLLRADATGDRDALVKIVHRAIRNAYHEARPASRRRRPAGAAVS